MKTDDFDFDLPKALIADRPIVPRDAARMLEIEGESLADRAVRDLPSRLAPGDVVVVNDTRVIPARLIGRRGAARIDCMLIAPSSEVGDEWRALARPGRRLKEGDAITFAPEFAATVAAKGDAGELTLRFAVGGQALLTLLERHGRAPLPPYIKRPEGPDTQDRSDYQTLFAARPGAVAAPTAAFHFTPELVRALAARDVQMATVTLHVGAGTFLPVVAEDVADHHMHREWAELSPAAARQINAARAAGGRVLAVGSTSLRTLESAADESGALRPFRGETDLFIVPGYRFRTVDLMLTNFHLPRSTLFMLVAAFSGLDTMRRAYAHAIAERYRFFSYGDCCLLHPMPGACLAR